MLSQMTRWSTDRNTYSPMTVSTSSGGTTSTAPAPSTAEKPSSALWWVAAGLGVLAAGGLALVLARR